VSLLPLPKDYVLGNGGEICFALDTPLVLLISTVLVVVSWWVLRVFMWPIRKPGAFSQDKPVFPYPPLETQYQTLSHRTKFEKGTCIGIARTTILSMLLVLLLVTLIIPWQVAFLVGWSIHLVTCACATYLPSPPGDAPPPPLRSRSPYPYRKTQQNLFPHDAEHILLLLAWLLPLTAPVLAE
jgi:glycosylphosphatidylinositol deacylase